MFPSRNFLLSIIFYLFLSASLLAMEQLWEESTSGRPVSQQRAAAQEKDQRSITDPGSVTDGAAENKNRDGSAIARISEESPGSSNWNGQSAPSTTRNGNMQFNTTGSLIPPDRNVPEGEAGSGSASTAAVGGDQKQVGKDDSAQSVKSVSADPALQAMRAARVTRFTAAPQEASEEQTFPSGSIANVTTSRAAAEEDPLEGIDDRLLQKYYNAATPFEQSVALNNILAPYQSASSSSSAAPAREARAEAIRAALEEQGAAWSSVAAPTPLSDVLDVIQQHWMTLPIDGSIYDDKIEVARAAANEPVSFSADPGVQWGRQMKQAQRKNKVDALETAAALLQEANNYQGESLNRLAERNPIGTSHALEILKKQETIQQNVTFSRMLANLMVERAERVCADFLGGLTPEEQAADLKIIEDIKKYKNAFANKDFTTARSLRMNIEFLSNLNQKVDEWFAQDAEPIPTSTRARPGGGPYEQRNECEGQAKLKYREAQLSKSTSEEASTYYMKAAECYKTAFRAYHGNNGMIVNGWTWAAWRYSAAAEATLKGRKDVASLEALAGDYAIQSTQEENKHGYTTQVKKYNDLANYYLEKARRKKNGTDNPRSRGEANCTVS